jgi:hypothetical protein
MVNIILNCKEGCRPERLARNERLHICGSHGDQKDQEHEDGGQQQTAYNGGKKKRRKYMMNWKRMSWMKEPIQ